MKQKSYQDILKVEFDKRKRMNPQFSLRAFAQRLQLSPSKLSEVLSRKKTLSKERLKDIAERLSMADLDKAIFLKSKDYEADPSEKNLSDLQALWNQQAGLPQRQRNAWYFSAIQTALKLKWSSSEIKKSLALTDLQLENAQRYLKRISQDERILQKMPLDQDSLWLKLSRSFESSLMEIDADHLSLTDEEMNQFQTDLKNFIQKYKPKKIKKKKSEPKLWTLTWSAIPHKKKETL